MLKQYLGLQIFLIFNFSLTTRVLILFKGICERIHKTCVTLICWVTFRFLLLPVLQYRFSAASVEVCVPQGVFNSQAVGG